uniref:Capsid protein n=1 Tax=Hubei levi-like virus 9 TaxID=1922921 RepID=A0A1L3KIG0_9VIRU|nr:hypothetical protein [Hubei levi-like virus 9]
MSTRSWLDVNLTTKVEDVSLTITKSPTLTGGTAVVLTLAGVTPGKSTYAFPDHSRLNKHIVETTVGSEGSKTNPVAKTGVKLTSDLISQEEGCCTTSSALIVFDVGCRYNLVAGNDGTRLDTAIAEFRAFVQTTAFADAVKAGTVPAV